MIILVKLEHWISSIVVKKILIMLCIVGHRIILYYIVSTINKFVIPADVNITRIFQFICEAKM